MVVGSFAINYLLEKSRVLTASQGERVYHSFYQAVKGKDASKYGLGNIRDYPSVISGGVVDNASMEDAEGDDLSYRVTNQCFAINGVSDDQSAAVWRVLAGILFAYKGAFKADGEGSQFDANEDAVDKAGSLWGVDGAALKKEILTSTIELKGEVTVMKSNVTQAKVILDSSIKALYKFLFDWLFEVLNSTTSAEDKMQNWIGLLDIFGFEDFKVNSFEQLCINLANETLQNHYNDYVFEKDMEECAAEGVNTTGVTFVDNRCTCELLNAKLGIFAMLDEECALGKGTDLGFLDKIAEKHAPHPSFEKKQLQKSSFTIKHFAGKVHYEVEGFLEKNRDSLKDSIKLIFRASSDPIIANLLPEPVEKTGRAPTASGIFRRQIDSLMEMINSTNPHWIRCIKPHPAKKPKFFLGQSVMEQMRSSGVLETIRIRKAGYPIRIKHAQFAGRFRVMAKDKVDPNNHVKSCELLVTEVLKYGMQEAQIGKTKVFMRAHIYQDAEEKKRAFMHSFAESVQRYAKSKSASLQKKEIIFKKFAPQLAFLEKLKAQRAEFKQAYTDARAQTEAEADKGFADLMAAHKAQTKDLEANKEKIQAWRAEQAGQRNTASRGMLAEYEKESDDCVAQMISLISAAHVGGKRLALLSAEAAARADTLAEEKDEYERMRKNFVQAVKAQKKEDERVKREAARQAKEEREKAEEERREKARVLREKTAQAALDRQIMLEATKDEIASRKVSRDMELMVKQHLLWQEEELTKAIIVEDARRARELEKIEFDERMKSNRVRRLQQEQELEDRRKARADRERRQREEIRGRQVQLQMITEQYLQQRASELATRGISDPKTKRLLDHVKDKWVEEESWEHDREAAFQAAEQSPRRLGAPPAYGTPSMSHSPPRDVFTTQGYGTAASASPVPRKALQMEERRQQRLSEPFHRQKGMVAKFADYTEGKLASSHSPPRTGFSSPSPGAFCGDCGKARGSSAFCTATGKPHKLL
eukprot:NODE_38_length_3307_cov_18.186004_g29_i0.p1 GENE.NODE_38_length_3307_cov_18.186004_g29_i0~~NODE_38_length_3307_cov_18.186004_g29_i0.p1  ORF type:complete len:1079 (-),score=398.82 NODE_38_length_3307_cov_18.186004_g29_i0:71-3034(-)